MPHVAGSSSGSGAGGGGPVSVAGGSGGSSSSSSGRIRDDPNDCDEVKVFKCEEDEGEGSSDDVMNEDKRDLIRATEYDQKGGRLSPLSPLSPGAYSGGSGGGGGGSTHGGGHSSSYSKNGQSSSMRPDPSSLFGKLEGVPHPSAINPMGWLGYPYANGTPLTMADKLRMGFLSFPCNGVEGLNQPPPAHMGYPAGLSRNPYFGIQYPYAGLPEVSQVSPWPQGMYPSISNARSPAGSAYGNYPAGLSIPTSIPSDFYSRFSPLLPGAGLGHPGIGHHLVGNHNKHDAHPSHLDNHRSSLSDQKSSDIHNSKNQEGQSSNSQNEKKKPHIKKPLNAFMLYMKEMRAKVVAECTLKESAAINQILGRRWHALGREEQAKYYELARRERQLHMQMYPNWSSAQNRTHHEKKRKKKQDQKFDGGNSMKKCRARYGLDQQSQWCKPCRRKKKCIRYLEEANGNVVGSANSVHSHDDNLGSAGSAGEPLSPNSNAGDSDMEQSSDMGMSSPFSLTSPGMSMTSPGMSLPSPAMTSPSGVLPSPSLASPAVSIPSLQSPMTPSLSEDRHPNSSVSSSTSSINFATTAPSASNGNNNNTCNSTSGTSSSQHHHQHHRNNNHSNPSPSSSYSKHANNFIPGTSPGKFGFGPVIGQLFNGSPGANGGLSYGQMPFPFGLPNLQNFQKPARNPVGANPHDINNPLSVNQLTGQCNSSTSSTSSASSLSSLTSNERSSSSHKSMSSNNHHRSERPRSRDRSGMSNSEGKSNDKNAPVPAPVIGVS